MARIDLLGAVNGLVCLYKPPEVSVRYMISEFAKKVASGFCGLDVKPPLNYLEVKSTSDKVSVNMRPSYLDNVLATGPKYQPSDISLLPVNFGSRTSGVCVLGINRGITKVKYLIHQPIIKVLHVKGKMGEATRFLYKDEKVMAKAKYGRIKRNTLEAIISSFQAAHQKCIFKECGVSIQSQEAYELAVEGLYKPLTKNIPVLYSIKCVDFNPPDFTLEIISLNETESYILKLIHDLGLQLKTFAHCTGIRCLRYGPFTVHNSLLLQECTIENIRKNIKICQKLLYDYCQHQSSHLMPVSEVISRDKNIHESNELLSQN